MTAKTTFPLSTSPASREAHIYYGHLQVQSERALEEATQIETLALTWITGDAISRGGRIHEFTTDGLIFDGQKIGSWRLIIRISDVLRAPIEAYRKNTLAQDGACVISLALPFLDANKTEDLEAFCVCQMARHARRNGRIRHSFRLRDSEGHEALVTIKKKRFGPGNDGALSSLLIPPGLFSQVKFAP